LEEKYLEAHRLSAADRRVPMKLFGPEREEVEKRIENIA
jgi:hypothetical protein